MKKEDYMNIYNQVKLGKYPALISLMFTDTEIVELTILIAKNISYYIENNKLKECDEANSFLRKLVTTRRAIRSTIES